MKRRETARIAASSAAALALAGAAAPVPAPAQSGPIVPLQRVQVRKIDPIAGAPYAGAPAARRPPDGERGRDPYSDPSARPGTAARASAAHFTAPGTDRRPIRARGGFVDFSERGNRGGAEGRRPGDPAEGKYFYR